ncbi:MAG TPA: hypothetical protein VI423_06985 [Paenisporosarcina sp.]|nr:hypothetical protein [Paenisporosarcina sp.]
MSNESARHYIAELEAERDKLKQELSDARKRIELDGAKLATLGQKLQAYRIMDEMLHTCIVCECSLEIQDYPPRCFDCIPDEKHIERWEEFIK